MKRSVSTVFALRNLKANRLLEIPFVLSSSIMLGLFYIMTSLLDNRFVQTRHQTLPLVITLGSIITVIFTTVFIFYANRFLFRQRNKEFALYGILGLEKKHIRRILGKELLILFSAIAFLTLTGGFIFGKLAFIGLNYLMKDLSSGLGDYPFSPLACTVSLLYLLILFLTVYFYNAFSLRSSSPVALLQKNHQGEGEPKSRKWLTLFGFLSLGIGYYMAMTVRGTLESLLLFFVAVLFVMLGSYLLFTGFSIIFLKWRKRKKSYYRTGNFLSISGMLYRMKSNAVSLASMAILITGVMIALSSSLTIYRQVETGANRIIDREYSASYPVENTVESYRSGQEEIRKIILESLPQGASLSNDYIGLEAVTPAYLSENQFQPLNETSSSLSPCYLIISTLSSYNASHPALTLQKGEVLISRNNETIPLPNTVSLFGKTYKVIETENTVPSNFAVSAYGIFFAEEEELLAAADFYKIRYRGEEVSASVYAYLHYDVQGVGAEEYREHMREIYDIESREEVRLSSYELNGGFVFLGIIITLLFLSGTILLMYYKQISEAYEDREAYRIMRNVGLDDSMIRQTSSRQIVWIFFLPLLVAVLHSFVASRITYNLLGLFGVSRYLSYAQFLVMIILSFMALYYFTFKITSNIYYKLVH